MRPLFVTLVVVTAILAAGCGAVPWMSASSGDPVPGKELFKTHCSSCHVLADAGATGTIGPNLDEVFGVVRSQGFEESTIRNVVRGQIAYPETKTATGDPGMPADLVTGQDARDVADYVARCAGVKSCPVG